MIEMDNSIEVSVHDSRAKERWISRFILLNLCILALISSCSIFETDSVENRSYNQAYKDSYLDKIAFPIGGMGAGMFCVEGTGAISHMSVRNNPDIFNEPCMFAAISLKGVQNGTKVLESQVPEWKKFGLKGSGNGSSGSSWGLPRFESATFLARFPFAYIDLYDNDFPLKVQMKCWSPFIPTDADNSSLPVGAIEYTFCNTGSLELEAVFSYSSKNFMAQSSNQPPGSISTEKPANSKAWIKPIPNGFVLSQEANVNGLVNQGDFAIFTDEPNLSVDYCWFRGGKFDGLTMAWKTISNGETKSNPHVEKDAPGASLFVPFNLKPGETKVIRLMMAWYVPNTSLRRGRDSEEVYEKECDDKNDCTFKTSFYKPWYSMKFTDINEVVSYWMSNYKDLIDKSELFKTSFYSSTLPPEVIEAVAANLTILKSPTILRQTDGKLWGWEGCSDNSGCCSGSCTHVWNYAQALPHLFPMLERTLRQTEFIQNQDMEGHQTFRAALPIRPVANTFHAASDGQLGGILKVYRDWRISGDNEWMKKLYPKVVKSIDYCIMTWDPRMTGTLEEPHHNTYDIEFWGADGMCTSIYLGALKAISELGIFLGEDVTKYEELYDRGKQAMEVELWNGEYFIQKIQWSGLTSSGPINSIPTTQTSYSDEATELFRKEGPKYQYGEGCLSDGVLGSWMGEVCGLKDIIDSAKVAGHLASVFNYNFKKDLKNHPNPQRPTFALGHEGGLLLCTWPKGGSLSLPFIYSNEVWTGIEYQVASHLMFNGQVEKGLEIVRACRTRYDGRVRNPFNEYECGHWYARAMSSYALLQGLTGVRYDAVDKVMYIDSRIGDFTSFISAETGFGNVGLNDGHPFVNMVYGEISIEKFIVSDREINY